jgi:hypothetical protein
MPSPFPGMDPYIEMTGWTNFHTNLAVELQRRINPLVLPRYVANVEERIYMETQYPERTIIPDISVSRSGSSGFTGGDSGTAVAELEPGAYVAAMPGEQIEHFVEVRDTSRNEVVTIIEILSPSNKHRGSDGFREYRRKWLDVLRSPVHLVEIDLLRAGERPATTQPLKSDTDYCVMVYRTNKRPVIDVYEWTLRRCLPSIPIPLAQGEPDIWIDLQSAFEAIYHASGYRFTLRYEQPLAPPLREADEPWVRDELAKFASR